MSKKRGLRRDFRLEEDRMIARIDARRTLPAGGMQHHWFDSPLIHRDMWRLPLWQLVDGFVPMLAAAGYRG
jgi:hypothetical protein